MKNSRFSTLTTLSVLGLLMSLGACKDPQTFSANTSDVFENQNRDHYKQADKVLQADYLFVMDYSSGDNIEEKRDALYSSFAGFTDALNEENIDYHIGIVDGGFQSHPSNLASYSATMNALNNNFITKGFFTSKMSGSLSENLINEVENVGEALNPNRFLPLETAEKVLNAQQSKFLRPGSQLVYVFVSDEDDQALTNLSSNRTPDYYIKRLKKFKSHGDYISSRAIVAGVAENCDAMDRFATPGLRIAEVSKALDSKNKEADCVYSDFSDTLQDLAKNISRPTKRFALRAEPVQKSIRVLLNGQNIPASNRWYYEGSTNEIVFLGTPPNFSETVDIQFDVMFTLSNTPLLESIEVEVNGQSVQKSDTNGWSYLTKENRIVFNGNSLEDNSTVVVRYQPQ